MDHLYYRVVVVLGLRLTYVCATRLRASLLLMIFHISYNGGWLASVSDLSMNFSALLNTRKFEALASSMPHTQERGKEEEEEKKKV